MKKFLPTSKKFIPSAVEGLSVNTSKGFTLIELLVVITIIALLSVIGIVAFTNAQKQARDGRRKADVDAVATALESNHNQLAGTYTNPVTTALFANNTIPFDPSTLAVYTVTFGSGNTSFVVCATLEIATGNSTSGTSVVAPGTPNTGGFYCRASQQ